MPRSEATARRGGFLGRRVVGAVVLVAAGVAVYLLQSPEVVRVRTVPSVTQGADVAPVREAVPARAVRGMPIRVVIPRLGVDATVRPIKAAGGVLIPPRDPHQLGWWADGALPGAARGSALVTGHTVHTGGGALDDLGTLDRGDRIRVRTSAGWIGYEVRKVKVYSKGLTSELSQKLFSQEVPGRLVLVTCTDWNGTRYLSNALVTATESSA